jgi:hypothetical protein
MSRKLWLAVALGLAMTNSVRANDLAKYLPDNSSMYVHINLNQLLTAPVIRKAVPLAFEKYGDQIGPIVAMAKQFNPGTPDIPEDQLKKGIDELKKEETIAKGFDAAKDIVTDVIITGKADDDEGKSVVILVKVPKEVTAEAVDAAIQFIPKEQVKSKQHKKDKATIHEFEIPQAPVAIFAVVPEPGVVALSMSKESAEMLVERAAGKKGEQNADFTKLMAQRKPTDFVFVTGIKGTGDDKEVMQGNLVLSKDITGQMSVTYATEEKAKKQGEEMKEGVASASEQLKGFLGDKKDLADTIINSIKTKIDGKTVSASMAITGPTVEKLLAKDN